MASINKTLPTIVVSAFFIAAIVALIVPVGSVFASSGSDIAAVEQYVEALDGQDWDSIIALSPNGEYDESIAFYSSEQNKENAVGFHAVKSAALTALLEIDADSLSEYTNADYYHELYGELKLYLAGVDLSVSRESKYFYNGVNFFLLTLGQEDGEWKVILFSQAPASVIEENSEAIGNPDDVNKALRIINARYNGIILNGNGEVIDTLI